MRVDPATHTAADVGDEPLLLATEAAVWVARDRPAGARAAAGEGAAVLVMDDGHQNPSLKKALSLIVVDGETRDDEWPFGDGAVFPSGPMREPLATGLARADAVIVLLPGDAPELDPELHALFRDLPVFIARLEPALTAAGCDLIDFAGFPDHAAFSERDLKALADQAAARGAGLVTTEKDWVRLPPEWRARVAAWPVVARFEDEAAVMGLLRRVVAPPA